MDFDPAHLLLVAAGGALGGLGRVWLSAFVGHRLGEAFPWGTLAVNVTGAFAIGMAAALLVPGAEGAALRPWLILAIGILGSYTTVSSFSLQTLALARESRWGPAAANVALSLGLCLAAVGAGYLAGGLLAGAGGWGR
jgi:fluoride exporter